MLVTLKQKNPLGYAAEDLDQMLVCGSPSFLLISSDSSRIISEIIWIRMWIYFYHSLRQKPASLLGTKHKPALRSLTVLLRLLPAP